MSNVIHTVVSQHSSFLFGMQSIHAQSQSQALILCQLNQMCYLMWCFNPNRYFLLCYSCKHTIYVSARNLLLHTEICVFLYTMLYVRQAKKHRTVRYQQRAWQKSQYHLKNAGYLKMFKLSTMLSLLFHFPLQFHIMLACYLLTLGCSSGTGSCSLSQVTL